MVATPRDRRPAAPGQAARLLRPPDRRGARRMPGRRARGVRARSASGPVFKTVDTCAAEFAAKTPYHYSTYDEETEVARATAGGDHPRLRAQPHRPGASSSTTRACTPAVHAARGRLETVMVNCNPETVSTDYDTSDRLYFEPLTLEDVLEVYHAELAAGRSRASSCQLGGQTPLGLAKRLKDAGRPRSWHHRRGDPPRRGPRRVRPRARRGGPPARAHGLATSFDGAVAVADRIGYPVLVRPSYVLGGRGMEIVYDESMLRDYIDRATEASPGARRCWSTGSSTTPVEIDVDALYDGDELFLAGVMEHIEEAGIHSGDSACALPPITLGRGRDRPDPPRPPRSPPASASAACSTCSTRSRATCSTSSRPTRASRTVPFVAKMPGVPLAKAAARVTMGATVAELRAEGLLPAWGDGGTLPIGAPIAVKEPCPLRPVPGVDTVLGPEMRSTGRGHGHRLRVRHRLRQVADRGVLQRPADPGRAFVSVANRDKRSMVFPVKRLADLGFEILATGGTAEVLRRNGLKGHLLRKQHDGPAERRADHGRRHPRGRDRPHRQHAVRRGLASTATRSAPPRCRGRPVHHHGAGAGGHGPGHRGPAARRGRGPVAAGVGGRPGRPACRTGPDATGSAAGTSDGEARADATGQGDRSRSRARCRAASRGGLPRPHAHGPGIAELTRPGHFVALAVGGEHSSMLLRRAFSIYSVQSRGSTAARSRSCSPPRQGTPSGSRGCTGTTPSTSSARSGGRSRCRSRPCPACLVAGGYGSAPMFPSPTPCARGLPGRRRARRRDQSRSSSASSRPSASPRR